jgi:tellurite methyltransferase
MLTGAAMRDCKVFWETVWGKEANQGFWTQADSAIVSLAAVPPGEHHNLLDLGCGLGRHAIPFAQAGHQVTAVDVTETAVVQVHSRAPELGLVVRTRLAASATISSRPRSLTWFWR